MGKKFWNKRKNKTPPLPSDTSLVPRPSVTMDPDEVAYWNDVYEKARKEFQERHKDNKKYPNMTLADYDIRKTIGQGSFGKVMVVYYKKNDAFYAMKCINKAKTIKSRQVEHTMSEKRLLGSALHPFIVGVANAFQDNLYLYLCMEFVNGGELFTYLADDDDSGRGLDERQARFYAAEVVLAFEYLHQLNIIYRDLKPENIMISYQGHLKIGDFGFAKILTNNRTYTFCGTLEYCAPELFIGKGYNKSADWWAVGILTYELVAGESPFRDRDQQSLINRILKGDYKFPSKFSDPLKDLVKQLLEPDVTKRYGCMYKGAEDIKMHAWFQPLNFRELYALRIKADYVPSVNGPGDMSKFRNSGAKDDSYFQKGGWKVKPGPKLSEDAKFKDW